MNTLPRRVTLLLTLSILLSCGVVLAQVQRCSEIVQQAFASVDALCEETSRNEACYGNISLEVEPQPGITDFSFSRTGDIEAVTSIRSMNLHGMDAITGEWGLALMRLQANLPDTLPGQNATVILFGDVNIEQREDIEAAPMQAFYLQTGLGQPRCGEVPKHGLLIQSPEGAREVAFNINGLDMVMGSTVLFQAHAGEEMIITTIEGSAIVEMDEKQYPVLAGTRIRIPLNDDLQAIGTPSLPESYDTGDVAALPTLLLEREIETAPPMPEATLNEVIEHLLNGEAPCGEDGLPECDSMLPVVDRITDVAGETLWGIAYDPLLDTVTIVADTLDPVTNAVGDTLDPLADAVGETLETLEEPLGQVVDPLADTVSPVVENVVEPVSQITDPVLDPIADTVAPIVEDVADPIADVTEPLDEALEPITEPVGEIVEPIGEVVEPIDEALEPVDDLLDPVDEIIDPVTEPVEDIVCEPLGGILGLLPVGCD